MPKGFIPNQDTGQIYGYTEGPQDISFDAMVRQQQQVAAILRANPNIEALSSSVGAGGYSASGNTGRLMVRLKPREQRQLSPEQVIEQLRPKLNAVPGIRAYLQNPPLIRMGGQVSKSLYQCTLQSTDIPDLYRAATVFERKMRSVPGLQDIATDLQNSSPQAIVDIDRDRASRLGITAVRRIIHWPALEP